MSSLPRRLPDIMAQLPADFAKYKVLPVLMNALEFGSGMGDGLDGCGCGVHKIYDLPYSLAHLHSTN